jgi:peptidoglycan/LPS O-acetylase OafA/YrhL
MLTAFAVALARQGLPGVLRRRGALAFLGAASYGLYLIHQHVGVALLHSLPPMSALGGALAAVAIAAGCSAVALASFRWIETPVSRAIRARLGPAPAREGEGRSCLAAAETPRLAGALIRR